MTDNPLPLVFGIMGNISKDAAVEAIQGTVDFLIRRRFPFILENDLLSRIRQSPEDDPDLWSAEERGELARRADVVITFGGDGTLLAVVQHTMPHQTPVLAVNLGKLGFLSDVGVDEVFWAIEQIIEGKYTVEKRMTITGHVQDTETRFHALNDIVVAKNGSTKVISIDAFVNGDFLASFIADGLIISTPTGSTAYSLATGGPVVVPSSKVIVISPISAHTLTARPVIVSGDSKIDVCARTEEGSVMVMADGRIILDDVSSVEVEIAQALHPVSLVKGLGPGYFETLRRKLSWAKDGRFTGSDGGSLNT